MAGAGILGVILGVILIKCKINRKFLLFSSAFGTVFSFGALGIYDLIVGSTHCSVVPTICLVAFLTIFNMGYGPLCYCMMAELFPDDIQHKAMSIVMVSFNQLYYFQMKYSFSYFFKLYYLFKMVLLKKDFGVRLNFDFQVFGGLFGFLNMKSLYLFETVLQLDQGRMFIIYASINAIGRLLLKFYLFFLKLFETLFVTGLLYLIFALPKDKVESIEHSPLSEVWYPALLSTRMTTIVATDLSTQDPAKAKALARKVQSDQYLRSIVLKMGVEFHKTNSAPLPGMSKGWARLRTEFCEAGTNEAQGI